MEVLDSMSWQGHPSEHRKQEHPLLQPSVAVRSAYRLKCIPLRVDPVFHQGSVVVFQQVVFVLTSRLRIDV
eukprot:CAMPEP_0170172824 /NCGR_PEP_ID=MMETSP0040_2-20121228/6099_1 /TAXON_ID=641309 /ORGANISM="Lotharella oceanica, Strain CCMP622" /LENGTH=70 /DNA_ID=CAMNT_0010413691 /DNA_START=288 /DNA_END=500 /DNA_ORIENTATION=+